MSSSQHQPPALTPPRRRGRIAPAGLRRAGILCGLLLWTAGCGGAPKGEVDLNPSGPLNVEYAQYDFSDNPQLLDRIAARPYGYFRFVNVAFADEVCQRFEDLLPVMPRVNLHGDAHLEQYAVTSAGRGLADFDDSCTGPAVIDLVRFGVAISLTHAQRGWGNIDTSIDALLRGYIDALKDPTISREAPGFVERAQKRFKSDRTAFLKWAEGLMHPVSPDVSSHLTDGFARYAKRLRARHELPAHFFDIKRFGAISLGFGSALDQKYLLRVEGKTKDPEDDVILEAKEVRDLSGIRCISDGPGGGALRILVSKARLTERPQPFLAEIPKDEASPLDEQTLWIHAWFDNYEELNIMETLASPEELRVIAYDVGAQLGRGHTLHIAAPFDEQLRQNQRRVVETYAPLIKASISEMTARTINGWQRFRADAEAAGATLPPAMVLPTIEPQQADAQRARD